MLIPTSVLPLHSIVDPDHFRRPLALTGILLCRAPLPDHPDRCLAIASNERCAIQFRWYETTVARQDCVPSSFCPPVPPKPPPESSKCLVSVPSWRAWQRKCKATRARCWTYPDPPSVQDPKIESFEPATVQAFSKGSHTAVLTDTLQLLPIDAGCYPDPNSWCTDDYKPSALASWLIHRNVWPTPLINRLLASLSSTGLVYLRVEHLSWDRYHLLRAVNAGDPDDASDPALTLWCAIMLVPEPTP